MGGFRRFCTAWIGCGFDGSLNCHLSRRNLVIFFTFNSFHLNDAQRYIRMTAKKHSFALGFNFDCINNFVFNFSEPSVRGVLIGYTYIYAAVGAVTIYLLNTLMPWRTVCLICLLVPIITAIAICFVSFFFRFTDGISLPKTSL